MKLAIISPFPPLKGGISKESEVLYSILKNKYSPEIFSFKKLYPNILYPSNSQFDYSVKNTNNNNIHHSIDIINPISWLRTANQITDYKCTHVIFRFWNPFFIPLYSFIISKIKKNSPKIKIFSICDNILPHERFVFDQYFIKSFLKKFNGYMVMSSDSERKLHELMGNKSIIIKSFLPLKDTLKEQIPKLVAIDKLNIKKTKLLLLLFGFIRPYKGFDLILYALADLKHLDIKLLIAGECYKDKNKYKKLIKNNGLEDNIIWHDKYIPESDINIYFSASDAVVLPYREISQSGVISIAYNYNKLIIASDLMGFKEHIINNKTGYIFRKNDYLSLRNTIKNIYNNHDFKLSNKSIEYHKKKYSYKNLINDFSNLLKL